MATQRLVNTNFWKDIYIIDLDPSQKLLFLYFLTNPKTTLAGVYEISLREVAFDTGIDRDMVGKILNKFCMDGKMYYENNWIVLRNFIKHQRMNPSIKIGIEKAIGELPDWLQKRVTPVEDDNQMTLLVDPAPKLYTDSYQSEPTEANLIKRKEKKRNITEANEMPPAVDVDEELATKERAARNRKPTTESGPLVPIFGLPDPELDKLFGGKK